METEKLENSPSAAQSSDKPPYFSLSDLFFISIVILMGITVIQLGYATWIDGHHTESAKSTGESVVEWMKTEAPKRSLTAEQTTNECSGPDKNWLNCREWMVSSSGPFKGLSNQIIRSNKLFSPACDRTQLDTLGSLIFEKGTPKPADPSSLAYSPLEDDEPLDTPIAIRLSICGRGFSVIRIADFTF